MAGVDELLREIRDAKAKLHNPKVVWFRGVPSERYELTPSLLRSPSGLQIESELFFRYKRFASRLHQSRSSDWELLFDMQHYGIPTRLLDWTETLGVALFFALAGTSSDTPALYLLDPVQLNVRGRKPAAIVDIGTLDYQQLYWHNTPVKPTDVYAVSSPVQNDRIWAQRGQFTLHGNDDRPLGQLAPTCVTKVLLRSHLRDAAREILHSAGLDEYAIFPDFYGVVPHLRRLVGL
jgi:hypothetical protein